MSILWSFFSQNLTQHLVNSECKGSVEKQSGRIGESKIPTFVKFCHVASCNTNVCNEMSNGNIDNGKRKNCSDKHMFDDNVAKVPVCKTQGCNIEMSLQHTHKKMKSVPIQMHAGYSFGKQAMAKPMCRDDVSTLGMQSITENHLQYWSQIDEFMELGDLLDLCGNDMTDIDCDNSQNDSTVEKLADCDNSQENVPHIDVNIQVNDHVNDTETANFAVVGAASLFSDADSNSYLIPVQNNVFCSVFTHEEHLMI